MENSGDISLELPLGICFSRIAKQYLGVLSNKLSHLEIERYYYPLVLIGKFEGIMTQQQLAEQLFLDKVTMVRVVDYLCKGGFIKRVQNTKDRREYYLMLTEKGRLCIPQIKKAITEVNQEAIKGIEGEEAGSLFELLEKITCNLSMLPAEKVDVRYRRLKK